MLAALQRVAEGQSLDRQQAEQAMISLVDGIAEPDEIRAFLLALRQKTESADEITGFVEVLRRRGVPVKVDLPEVIDVCGTGGDGHGTFNVSTVVAFVLASAGVAVAKHGNRSVSSRSGSFDVLEALGIPYESDPARAAASIEARRLGFLFAPAFHPALRELAPIRRSLGVSTVFNALGPLLNPVEVTRQLIGVYSPVLIEKIEHVLRARGLREAMVVRGEDGLDEITLNGLTRVAHLREGRIRMYLVRPADFGLDEAPLEAVRGGTPAENARTLLEILQGARGPKRDLVLINAAAALVVAGRAPDFRAGAALASETIDSGAALGLVRAMGVTAAGSDR
jgi:anthranilate phosphoribosyltransferase